ncbi:hypothetical protein [Peptacetobacter hominis]|uniref:hypothetical protein n=1 Tax=Peptacetobacter hominis TaxID=2743610 RepID=UPI0015827200|nr:hypothetical protein [Peptacetobacter hominis]
MKREENKKIVIEEKIELKDVTLQGDPCKVTNPNAPCKYNCCSDCYDGKSSYPTIWY